MHLVRSRGRWRGRGGRREKHPASTISGYLFAAEFLSAPPPYCFFNLLGPPPSPGRKQIKLIATGAGTEGPRNSQPSASVQYVFSVPTLGKLCNTRVGRLATATSISGSRLQGAGFKGLASPGHNG